LLLNPDDEIEEVEHNKELVSDQEAEQAEE
jgi:hypothetical protein